MTAKNAHVLIIVMETFQIGCLLGAHIPADIRQEGRQNDSDLQDGRTGDCALVIAAGKTYICHNRI